MIKRIPLVFFVLTIASFLNMIFVRISAMGTKVLSMSTSFGRHIAKSYNSSVVWFLIFLALLIISVWVVSRHQAKIEREKEERKFDFYFE